MSRAFTWTDIPAERLEGEAGVTSHRPATGRHIAAGKCVYCNDRPAVTRDHVIARQFFPEPKPSNLPTVPSCEECNSSFRPAEEYLCTSFLSHAHAVGSNPEADRLAKMKLLQRLDKRPELRELLFRQMIPVASLGIQAPPGITHGFTLDPRQTKIVLTKITKGLLYYHKDVVLAEGYAVKTWFEKDYDFFAKWFVRPFIEHRAAFERLGGGVFSYRRLFVKGNPAMSSWLFCFYDAVFAAAYTAPTYELAEARRRARVRRRRQSKKVDRRRGH